LIGELYHQDCLIQLQKVANLEALDELRRTLQQCRVRFRSGGNFTNILRAHFFVQKCFWKLFSNYILVLYVIFLSMNIGAKAARKILAKLATVWTSNHG